MTTAAERLVLLSGMAGVSAGQHMLAVTQGGGTGTVLAAQTTVWIEQFQTTLVRRPVRVVKGSTSALAARPEKRGAEKHSRVDVLVRFPNHVVFTQPNEAVRVSQKSVGPTVLVAPKVLIVRRKKATFPL